MMKYWTFYVELDVRSRNEFPIKIHPVPHQRVLVGCRQGWVEVPENNCQIGCDVGSRGGRTPSDLLHTRDFRFSSWIYNRKMYSLADDGVASDSAGERSWR